MSLFYRLPSYQDYDKRVSQKDFLEEIKSVFERKYQQSIDQINMHCSSIEKILEDKDQETQDLAVNMLELGYVEGLTNLEVFMVKNHLAIQLAKLSLKVQGHLDFLLNSLSETYQKSQATLEHYSKVYQFIDPKYRHKTDTIFQEHYEYLQAQLPEGIETLLSEEYRTKSLGDLSKKFRSLYYQAVDSVPEPGVKSHDTLDKIDFTPFTLEGTHQPDYGYANINQLRLDSLVENECVDESVTPVSSEVDLEKPLLDRLASYEVKKNSKPLSDNSLNKEQELHNSLLNSAKTFLRASIKKTFDHISNISPSSLSKSNYEELRNLVDELEADYQFEELPPIPTVDKSFVKVNNLSEYKKYTGGLMINDKPNLLKGNKESNPIQKGKKSSNTSQR